jgi:endonuclease YncB( thermonuclease family)
MANRIATASISRWIDADTVVLGEMDLGWGVAIRDDPRRQTTHVRLVGVNAPDSRANAKWYDPTLKAVGLAYVTLTYPAGTAVVVTSYELDDFGRSLATIVTTSGADIAADLLAKGFVRTGDYPVPAPET